MSERLDVRFSVGDDLLRHKAFLAAHAGANPLPAPRAGPQRGERWAVTQEWDASHTGTPGRGIEQVNPPLLVGWSPDGNRLFSSCNADGLTVWDTRGTRLGEDLYPYPYGNPYCLFVAQRGDFHWVLQVSQFTSVSRYHLHDPNARLISTGDESCLPFGWARLGDKAGLNRRRGIDPWRPGSHQIAFVHEYSSVKIVDVTGLPDDPAPAPTGINRLASLFRKRSVPARRSAKVPLHAAPPIHWLSFDSLGERNRTVFGFHFHPSGEYIAVTTGDWADRETRVHIVHVGSASIVSTIPSVVECRGWSPGGRYLLFVQKDAKGQAVVSAGVWDGATFDTQSGLSDDLFAAPWVAHSLTSDHEMALSADGLRVLTRSGGSVNSVIREGLGIRSGEELARVADYEFAHAEWHPHDPHCFATVGGAAAAAPASQHDKMLRIWRLV